VSKEDWQKPYIQRVLDYHNQKYSRNIILEGRCEEIHPELKGKHCWDWSAIDMDNGGKVAIEVKRLTTPLLQERFSELDKICHELSGELSGVLKGVFILFTEVSEAHFDLKGANKQQLKENLKELILKEAQSLGAGRKKDLTTELIERLPEVLPQHCYFRLHTLDNEGSYLSPCVGSAWAAPYRELQGEDLVEFQKLVQSANQQLGEAKAKGISDTFLIIIEIWFSGAEADVLQATLRNFDPGDFPHIKFLYLVGAVSLPNIHELPLGDINPYPDVSSH
jgi:hypothetical protein